MARFTVEQKKISEAMKLLIDLYYRFLETDPKEWFSDEIIQLIAKILERTIPNFRPCLFFREYSMFRYRGKDERVRISEIQINDFITLMNLIHADISDRIIYIFNFLNLILTLVSG